MERQKMDLIDLHTHSLLSDGVLLPSELVRRYEAAGFKAVAITDHVDLSNINIIVPALVRVCKALNRYNNIKAIPGVELTHIPPPQFKPLVKYARKGGAKIVIGHGETVTEPVKNGTNRQAIEAGVDILAHPGMITKADAALAAKKGVLLEITTRRGHSAANRYVAKRAKETSAKIIINSDSHMPADIPSRNLLIRTARDAGLSQKEIVQAYANSENLVKRIIGLT